MRGIIKLIVAVMILCSEATSLFGQEMMTFNVKDQNTGKAVSDVVILVLNQDSVVVSTSLSDLDGSVQLNHFDTPLYLVLSHLNYETLKIRVDQLPIADLQMTSKDIQLKEVEVTANRKTVTIESGKLVYDVSTIQNKGVASSVFDVIRRLPSIISTDGNTLSLAGSPQPITIIINGQKSMMNGDQVLEMLKSLPANKLENVELSYNPPASWGVKGIAINVVLKEKLLSHIAVQSTTDYSYRYAHTLSEKISFNLQQEKYSIDAIYGISHLNTLSKYTYNALHSVRDEQKHIKAITETKYQKPLRHYLYIGGAVNITDKVRFQGNYLGEFSNRNKQEIETSNSLVGSSTQTGVNNSSLHSVNMKLTFPASITLSANLLNYTTDNKTNFAFENQPLYVLNQKQSVSKYGTKLNGNITLPKGWNVNYGARFSYSYNKNESVQGDDRKNSSEVKEYQTKIHAGFNKTFIEKLNMDFSLEGEWFKVNDFGNFSMLPNITLNYQANQNNTFTLYYSSYFRYPSYWQRLAYIQEKDGYEYYEGNPELKNQRTDAFGFNYIFKNKYVLSSGYQHYTAPFLNQGFQLPDRFKRVNKPTNFAWASYAFINFQLPFTLWNKWNVTLLPNIFHERYVVKDWHGISYDRKAFAFAPSINSSIRILDNPGLYFNTYVSYRNGGGVDGIEDKGEMILVNAGLDLSAFKNRLSISLVAYDLFESMIPIYTINYENQHFERNYNYYQRGVFLTLTYRFRSYKKPSNTNMDSSRLGVNL